MKTRQFLDEFARTLKLARVGLKNETLARELSAVDNDPLAVDENGLGRCVAGEFVYDHPFQWGSKRTGPDLHRVGGKYSDEWHRLHLNNPRDLVPESNMPAYTWLATAPLQPAELPPKLRAMRTLGVPYTDADIAGAAAQVQGKTELDALVAYLQVLGTALK